LRYGDGRAWLDGRLLNEPVQFTEAADAKSAIGVRKGPS
jgi:hypothetical protein